MTEATTTHDETSPSTEPQSASPQIPKDLSDLWGAVRALATAFTVIKSATHQHENFKAVDTSLKFLKELHDESLTSCRTHEMAHTIVELKQINEELEARQKAQEKRERKAQKKAEQNGEEETEH